MNRQQISPLRLRPKKVEIDVDRIINHAVKLANEYNQIKIKNIMKSEQNNLTKINELLSLSSAKLPRLTRRARDKKYRKRGERKNVNKKISKSDDESIRSENKKNNSIKSTYSSLFDESKEKEESVKEEDQSEFRFKYIHADDSINKSVSFEKNSSIHSISQCSSAMKDEERDSSVNRTLDEVMTLTSRFSVKHNQISQGESNPKEEVKGFMYELEIVTGKQENTRSVTNVFITINDESNKTTEKILLEKYFVKESPDTIPFLPGNIDKFRINLVDYLDTIDSVVIGLNPPFQETLWFLESICVIDKLTLKDYRFPCRRWLGLNKPDQLTELKLGYTPPYTGSLNFNRSRSPKKSNEDLHYDKDLFFTRLPLQNTPRSLSVKNEKEININDNISENRSQASNDIKENNENVSVLFGKSIHSAVKSNDFTRVKELCTFHDSLKCSEDDEGYAPIHLAAMYYKDNNICRKIIHYIISCGVDPNIKSRDGYTPFLLAVMKGNLDSVKYLKENIKINCDERDKDGNTALHLAIFGGFDNIVQYILSEGFDISIPNNLGETPLDLAKRHSDKKMLYLFRKIISFDSFDNTSIEDNIWDEEQENGKEKESKIMISEEVIDDKFRENIIHERNQDQSKENEENKHINKKNSIYSNNLKEDTQSSPKKFEKVNADSGPEIDKLEFEDDNRGISFNKSLPLKEQKTEISNPKSKPIKKKTIPRFNDYNSAESDNTSPISSRLSSSLTVGTSDSSSESIIVDDPIKQIVTGEKMEKVSHNTSHIQSNEVGNSGDDKEKDQKVIDDSRDIKSCEKTGDGIQP